MPRWAQEARFFRHRVTTRIVGSQSDVIGITSRRTRKEDDRCDSEIAEELGYGVYRAEEDLKSVFVVGAGPAGLFAAQKIALAGHEVFLFNRDIKPGGLAEYGIYPLKNTMKVGLRKQFSKVLGLPNLHYFGNVKIGSTYDITLDDLQALAPSALVVACGAQGYNKLNLPGENARGVYSAKDFVYHYN